MLGTGIAMTDLPSPLSAQRPHSHAVFSTAMCHDITTPRCVLVGMIRMVPRRVAQAWATLVCVNFQHWHQRYTKGLPIPEIDG